MNAKINMSVYFHVRNMVYDEIWDRINSSGEADNQLWNLKESVFVHSVGNVATREVRDRVNEHNQLIS